MEIALHSKKLIGSGDLFSPQKMGGPFLRRLAYEY